MRAWPITAVLIGMYGLNSGWAAIFLYHAGIVSAAFATGLKLRDALGVFRWLPAVCLWSIGVLAAPFVVILLPWLQDSPPESVGAGLLGGLNATGLNGVHFWLFVGYLCVIHPLIEEIGWREVLFVDSKRIHLRDFEFASYHLLVMHYFFPFEWMLFAVSLVSLAAMGWVWRLMKMKYRGIAIPTWFHAGGDLGAMLGVWWLIRGN